MTNTKKTWATAALAVLLPAIALSFAVPLGEDAPKGPPPPFGWWPLLAAQLVAGVPLAVLLASQVPDSPSRRWVGGGAALLAGLTTLALGTAAGPLLDSAEAGFAGRLLARASWCLALQLPLCLAMPAPSRPPRSLLALPLALLVAVALPGAYAASLARSDTRGAEQLLAEGQLTRALALLDGLHAAGSRQPVAGAPPGMLRARLVAQVRQYQSAAARSLPTNAGREMLTERARCLAMLGRLDEAAGYLGGLADRDFAAAALLASIRQRQRLFAESSEAYRAALVLANEEAQQRRAYDGLAFNAREQKDPREAERLYLEALKELPSQRAHFHHQLGRHHSQGNRPSLALTHLREAARLDPANHGESARRLIEDVRQATPGCLLRGAGP